MTANDWALMPNVLALLESVLQAGKAAESDGASVADMIPLTKKLRMKLERSDLNDVSTPKEALFEQIRK